MNTPYFQSFLAPYLHQFVQYKRALNRKYLNDAHTLRMFVGIVEDGRYSTLIEDPPMTNQANSDSHHGS